MAKKNKRASQSLPSWQASLRPVPSSTLTIPMIKKDLARIGILAGIFFSALIVLSFFIN